MTSRDNAALANHVLQSIQKDLDFLKSQQHISPQAYDDVLRILPTQITSNSNSRMNSPYNSGSPYTGSTGTMSSPGPMPSPASSYTNHNNSATPPPPPPNYATATSLESVEAMYDFHGQNSEDLSFQRGDIIQVTEHVNNDWWKGTLRGRTGLFPSTYVQKCMTPRKEKPTPPSTPSRNSMPPPPPPASGNYGYPLPPPSNTVTNYAYPPPPAQQYNNGGYAPPPVQSVPEQQVSSSSGGNVASKASGMFSKVGGQIANAATLGFGATRKWKE
ncbi:SH3 domain-containing protein [Chlamydoabsidia padenii]|nr:SH3 domain-containing protein [Chlamydoabsidia padenii]